jgi:hypothetical protein
MLAYLIIKYIHDKFETISLTRKDILDNLDAIQYRTYYIGKAELKILPNEYLEKQKLIFDTLNVNMPKYL